MGKPAAMTPADKAPAAEAPPARRTPTTLPVDEFHGQGGTYEVVDGVRRPVQPPAAPTDAAEAR